MRRLNWLDMLVYRIFYWRWNKIFYERADLRKLFIYWMQWFDNEGYIDDEDMEWILQRMKAKKDE